MILGMFDLDDREGVLAKAAALEDACRTSAPDLSMVRERLVDGRKIEVKRGWYGVVAAAHAAFLAVRPDVHYRSVTGGMQFWMAMDPYLGDEDWARLGEPGEDPRIREIQTHFMLMAAEMCELCGTSPTFYRGGMHLCETHSLVLSYGVDLRNAAFVDGK
jgi:hypothetical protein